ncbi:MAG: cytochrome c oxidase subunit 3 [Planctomycetota bacterium]
MTAINPDTGGQPAKREPWEDYTHQHHWRNGADEFDAAKLGMWLFLATEVLLFSGFFCAYFVFRMQFPENWHEASRYYLSWEIGFANTCVLLLSSFTVVLAIRAAQLGKKSHILFWLLITQLCAGFFLVVKLGWEYWPKIVKDELPGANFAYGERAAHVLEHAAANGIDQAVAMNEVARDHIFLSLYWVTTATHGVHVLVGMIVFAWCMYRAWRGHYGPKNYIMLENCGLYWHIVDIIWIFVFPLYYLV